MVAYGAPPGGAPQAYPGAPPPQQQYGAPQQNYGATPFDSQPGGPPHVQTAPTSVTPMAQATPSTLGFGSPQPDFSSFAAPPAAAPSNDFAGQYGAAQPPAQQQYGGANNNQFGYGGGGDQFGASQTSGQQYGGGDPFGASQASGQQQQYGGGDPYGAPQASADPFGGGASQGGAPPPSPGPDQGFGQQPEQAAAPANNGPVLTMNSLQGQDQGLLNGNDAQNAGSLADQAYAKFASMDQFDLVGKSKKDTARENPFESQPIGAQASLADLKKTSKVRALLLTDCELPFERCHALIFFFVLLAGCCQARYEFPPAPAPTAWSSGCFG
mgnify:CR=1 FL=1